LLFSNLIVSFPPSISANLVLQNIKEGIEGHPVSWYSEVFDILFADLNRDAARTIWQKVLAKPANQKNERDGEDDE
jgi:Lon-like ATP-dependent protease